MKTISKIEEKTYYVFDLSNGKEHHFMESVPRKQALKSVYAFENGLGSQFATCFGKVMSDLESLIQDTGKHYSIGDFTVLKEQFAD